jgi:hypothetical protein
MGCFKSEPPSIEFNAVADDVNKTEPFPKQGLPDAGLEMVEVIDGCAGVKIWSLGGKDSPQTQGLKNFTSRRCDRFCSLGCGGTSLASGQSINLIVIAEDRDIWISSRRMEEVISADGSKIPIPG